MRITRKNKSGCLIKKRLIGSFSVMFIMTISGCNGSKGDLDNYFEEQRAKQPEPIEAIPEVKPYVRFAYPNHSIDPFDAAVLAPAPPEPKDDEPKPTGIQPDYNRTKEFLESFPLDSLRMVGTVERDNTRWALVRIPEGSVQTVKQGNYVGQNHGQIMDISDVEMSMLETVSDGLNGFEHREISITLNQE